MRVYLQWPKTGNKKKFIPGLILAVILFGSLFIEEALRNESDFESLSKFCGVVKQYGLVKTRGKGSGRDSWHLTVRAKPYKTEMFKVGYSYIHKPMQREKVKVGDEICVQYVSISPFFIFRKPFIVQMSIEGKYILDKEKVLDRYIRKPSNFYFFMFLTTLFLTSLCVIYKNKGN